MSCFRITSRCLLVGWCCGSTLTQPALCVKHVCQQLSLSLVCEKESIVILYSLCCTLGPLMQPKPPFKPGNYIAAPCEDLRSKLLTGPSFAEKALVAEALKPDMPVVSRAAVRTSNHNTLVKSMVDHLNRREVHWLNKLERSCGVLGQSQQSTPAAGCLMGQSA